MIIDILKLVISFMPFILMGYYFITLKKRESIYSSIKSGYRCYSCKEYLPDYETLEPNFYLCKSCDRDKNIQILLNNRIYKLKLNIKKFLIKLSPLVVIGFFGLIFLITICDIIISYAFNIDIKYLHLTQVTSLLNTCVWAFMILQRNATTIKK